MCSSRRGRGLLGIDPRAVRLRVRRCRWMRRRRGPDLQRREWIGHALQEIWLSLPGLGGKCRGSLLVLSGEPVLYGEGGGYLAGLAAVGVVVSLRDHVCALVGVDGVEHRMGKVKWGFGQLLSKYCFE